MLEIVTALEPMKKSVGDKQDVLVTGGMTSLRLFLIGFSAVTISSVTSAFDGGESSDSTNELSRLSV